MTACLWLVGAFVISNDPVTAGDFWAVVEEIGYRDLVDVRFLYEGRYWKVDGDGEFASSSFRFTYQGEFMFHRDGVARCDVFLPGDDTRELRSLRRAGDHRLINTGPGYKRQEKKPMAPRLSWVGMVGVHSAARHWWLPVLRYLPVEARSALKELRTEMIDGREVHLVLLDLLPNETGNRTWHMRMWIDLARGANLLRCEWLHGGKIEQRAQVLQWKQFNDRAGKQFWLPVQSVWESFVTERLNEYASTPTYRESFKLLDETVALNTGLRADSLEVTFDPKSKIVDLTAPQPPAVPAELRPTGPRLTTETVEKTLRQAKEQRAELLQRASQRMVRTDWTGWIAMGLAFLGLSVLVASWYLRRLRGG